MTDASREQGRPVDAHDIAGDERTRDDAIERTLGRVVGIGLPIASVAGAIVVGVMAGVGSALLVLAAGVLIGAVALLWASVRTLGGDAPLAADFEALSLDGGEVDELDEEKRRLLRAIKDVESEHALGKMDDADYEAIVARYRGEAKDVMRKMEVEVAPFRERAERLAHAYLEKYGLVESGPRSAPAGTTAEVDRLACPGCGTSNDSDAMFCKKCGGSIARERPGAAT